MHLSSDHIYSLFFVYQLIMNKLWPVCLVFFFKNSNKWVLIAVQILVSPHCITFDNFFLKQIISHLYIVVRSFLLNKKNWSFIALFRKNGILLKTWVYPRGTWLYFIYFNFFHKISCESYFFAYIWLDWRMIHHICLSFTWNLLSLRF